jgi:hypothetical protein
MLGLLTRVESVRTKCGRFASCVEPASYIDAYMAHPPSGFRTEWVESGPNPVPGFACKYDLRTTIDASRSPVLEWLRTAPLFKGLTSLDAFFCGTPVSEYALIPETEYLEPFFDRLLATSRDASLVIIKDIPENSPILSDACNQFSANLIREARRRDFSIVEGQAIAYVPIDFQSIDEYIGRLSRSRRKDFRRKLRAKHELSIEVLHSGSPQFGDPDFVDLLYRMYLNVLQQSEHQFDRLTKEFWNAVLNDRDSGGLLFLYRRNSELIGWNFCFVRKNLLIDKYVGFTYPAAVESNVYFVSWFHNLEFALAHGLTHYVASASDPQVKRALGAQFTFTKHAVFLKSRFLARVLKPFKGLFECDKHWSENVDCASRVEAVSLIEEQL